DRYVRGVETPDFAALLEPFGLKLAEKPEKAEKDGDETDASRPTRKADLGWKTKNESGRLVVSEVWAGRAAYEAGISPGDELVAVDGVKADEDHVKRLESDATPGTRVVVTVFRRGRLTEIPVTLGSRRAFTYEIRARANRDARARGLCRGWLKKPLAAAKAAR